LHTVKKYGAVIARRYNIAKRFDIINEAIFFLTYQAGRLLRVKINSK